MARAPPPGSRRPERRRHPPRRHRVLPFRLLRLGPGHAQHRRAGRRRRPVLELPRHTALLADPGRAPDRAQPPHRGDAGHLQLRQRLPAHAGPHLRPRHHPGGGAAGPGVRHLRGGQVAPLPDGERLGRRPLRPVAAAAGLRPLLRVPRGGDRPVLPRPGVRQPPHRAPGHPRGRLPPERGPGRQRHRVRPRLRLHPSGPPVLHLPGLRRHARPPPGTRRVPRQMAGEIRRRVGRGP